MSKLRQIVTNQRLVGFLFLLLSGLYVHFTEQIYLDFWSEAEVFNARTMPYLFGYGAMICASLLIVVPSRPFDWTALLQLKYLPALCLAVLLLFYALAIDYLGFVVTSTTFLGLGFIALGQRQKLKAFGVALTLSLVFYFGLSALDIYLSPGEWWFDD